MPKVYVQTRFSFFGKSGWKSEIAQDPTLLFAEDRLVRRFDIFERFTLPSMADQKDGDFTWDILAAEALPAPWKRRLRDTVKDRMGDRAVLHFEPPARAGRYFRNYMLRRYRGVDPMPLTAQVVLDDDDALSCDFVELLRAAADKARADVAEHGYVFLSFPTGYWVVLEPAPGVPLRLKWMRERFVNLGLTLLAPGDSTKGPYLTAHRVLGRRHPARTFYGQRPVYLRTVHGDNDSVPNGEGAALTPADLPAHVRARFPLLGGDVAVGGAASRGGRAERGL